MSQTYSIGCRQCKKHLWIGQSGVGGHRIYSGVLWKMTSLSEFLFEHCGHELLFDDNVNSEMFDWYEIDDSHPHEN